MKRALIMEDEMSLAFDWRDAFALNQFNVTLTHNGEDAAAFLESEGFDIVIVDLFVKTGPGGLFVISKLARMGAKAPPVIAVTGAGQFSHRANETNLFLKQAGNLGASATMEKPFLAAELLLEAEKLIITSKQP
jgi:DNA-binding response OmpR family regulator